MRGEILSYDDVSGTGLISGDDSIRYGFARSAIQAGATIRAGARVDFVAEGLEATQIMVLAGDPAAAFGQAAQSTYVARDTGGGYDFQSAMLSFNGRLRRQHFWISWLILLGAGVVLGWIPILGTILSIAMIWPNLAIVVKRLHDMGKTGWFAVVPWVANIVGFIMIISAVGMSIITNPQAFENEDPEAMLAMFGSMMGGIAVMFLVNIAFLLWIGIGDSQRGDNKYGPNPKGE
ncbi:uncharacterized membrane protein YhaH (DUF805 family) [Brevundimonas bullata]|uniref:Uncharacterized membrane protein YhaH (DUF805 family) n=1 Tax=Brevundimonas bullata TaxID=13160 RepID=A0A7W7IQN7_9CAUL|nr:DUF805 domain-containing protein [Brevundimonas bullata]MBB4798538.1 uncharacterized membrane protein YhaH (DUF805 family) [Brevundimonas bullata]MBB6383147.1 uncharacterized membrane protein YhaH (DUF805 family) [Brevundimonas bullata]